jgi:hypothetical protein
MIDMQLPERSRTATYSNLQCVLVSYMAASSISLLHTYRVIISRQMSSTTGPTTLGPMVGGFLYHRLLQFGPGIRSVHPVNLTRRRRLNNVVQSLEFVSSL